MSRSVDYFEVGKQQLSELVDHDMSFSYGDYVVVSMGAVFGRVSDELNLVERYSSEYWAFRHAENMQRMSFTFSARYGCVLDYEVWHVVDDAELWDEWELKVAKYRLECGQAVWRVYERNMPVVGGTPVMELDILPRTIYHLICRDVTGNWFVSDDWYSDGHKFCEGLDTAIDNGYYVVYSDVFDQGDAVTIVLGDTGYELDEYDGSVFEVTLRESC